MNKNLQNMLTITHNLTQAGKEPTIKVLPSAAKRQRRMMLRNNKSVG